MNIQHSTCNVQRSTGESWGFSLIEVNLAILLVTIGLLTLFALFPMGLRESEMAVVDTQEAMFADHVLSGIKANAQDITDWDEWTNHAEFVWAVEEGIDPIDSPDSRANPGQKWDGRTDPVEFPETGGASKAVVRKLRYRLYIQNDAWAAYRKRAILEVKSGTFGQFDFPQVYSTELVFEGMSKR